MRNSGTLDKPRAIATLAIFLSLQYDRSSGVPRSGKSTWSSEVGHTTASGERRNFPERSDQMSERPCPAPCLARSCLDNETWNKEAGAQSVSQVGTESKR